MAAGPVTGETRALLRASRPANQPTVCTCIEEKPSPSSGAIIITIIIIILILIPVVQLFFSCTLICSGKCSAPPPPPAEEFNFRPISVRPSWAFDSGQIGPRSCEKPEKLGCSSDSVVRFGWEYVHARNVRARSEIRH